MSVSFLIIDTRELRTEKTEAVQKMGSGRPDWSKRNNYSTANTALPSFSTWTCGQAGNPHSMIVTSDTKKQPHVGPLGLEYLRSLKNKVEIVY